MTIQTINIGSAANDGTGDPLRSAFDKTNDNFGELDTRVSAAQAEADASVKSVNGNSPDTDGDVTIDAASDWGTIGGTLSAQTDLQDALDAKADASATTSALAGKQPLDSDLTAIAALTTTAFGRGVLEVADAAAAKTYLEVTEGGGAWGEITGTLADQTDLQSALDDKADASVVAAALGGKQDASSELVALAALTSTSFGRGFLELDDDAAARAYIDVSAGGGAWGSITGTLADQTDLQSALDGKQDQSSELDALAALTSASFGRSFLELADAPAAFTLLGLGSIAEEDYEVGTFTPTLYGTSVAGTNTYSVQVGNYVKVAGLVWVSIKLGLSAVDGAMAGNLRISGLPFVSENLTDLTCLASTLYSNITYASGRTQAYGSVGPNTDYVNLGATGSGSALAALTETSVTSGSLLYMSMTYPSF